MILVTAAATLAASSSGCSDSTQRRRISDNGDGGDDTSGSSSSSTSSGSSSSSSGQGGSAPVDCKVDGDCLALADACNNGKCLLGACVKVIANEGASCEDGKQCTVEDSCQGGKCVGGSTKFCPSSSSCTVGECDVASDTCVEVPANEGGFCDDGLFCTLDDQCSAGTCTGNALPCPASGDPCQINACDEIAQGCVLSPGNNGAACDDANGCTGGTSCQNGTCGNPMTQIVACINNDMCCPAGCANDTDCTYWASGVQQNVPAANLKGWTQCYSGTYTGTTALTTVLTQCDKAKLLLACRPVGSATFTLLAMAPRVDVLFDCGTQLNCTKQSNGVGWYYNNDYSWGFAPGGQAVNRSSCDYNDGAQVLPGQRMCWHTDVGNFSAGYRCGDNDLNSSSTWERVIFESN